MHPRGSEMVRMVVSLFQSEWISSTTDWRGVTCVIVSLVLLSTLRLESHNEYHMETDTLG